MRKISDAARERVENVANLMLHSAVVKHGAIENVPANDPDYAEAFGILRGVCCYLNSTNDGKDTHEWMDKLKQRFNKAD